MNDVEYLWKGRFLIFTERKGRCLIFMQRKAKAKIYIYKLDLILASLGWHNKIPQTK